MRQLFRPFLRINSTGLRSYLSPIPNSKGSFSKSSRRPRSISCAKSDRPAPIRVPARSVQRVAEYPGAFASHTREELIENTRKVLYPAIKKALTEPIAPDERTLEGEWQTVTPPWLAWTGHETIDAVPTMQTGKNIFLVTGDPARNKELCLPGGGSATIRIVLPAAWNTLMAERGYAPLDSYKLTSDLKPDTPRQKVRGDRRWRF